MCVFCPSERILVPSNVNDGDFYPGMSKSLQARTGTTEMTFALTRFETNIFSLRLNDALAAEQVGEVDSIVFKDGLVAECRHAIQEKYLKHLERKRPLLRTTATIARLSLAKLWLVAHGLKSVDEPSKMILPGAAKDRLFTKALQIIESYHTLSGDEETAKWHWLLHTYVSSQILAFMLSELCVRELGPEERRAWSLINEIWYDDGLSRNHNKAPWQASLRRLVAATQSRMVGHVQPATLVQTK